MGNKTTGKSLLNLLWHQNNIQPLFGIENGHISKTKSSKWYHVKLLASFHVTVHDD